MRARLRGSVSGAHGALTRRTVLGAGLLALGACAGLPASDSAAIETLPLELDDKDQYLVPVRVNRQRQVRFKIDTGASMTALFPASAGLGEASEPVEYIQVWGLGGGGLQRSVRLRELSFGGRAYADRQVPVLDGRTENTFAGLIGMDILQDFAAEFRDADRKLVLRPPGASGARSYLAWDRIRLSQDPYESHGFGLQFAEVRLRDEPVSALIDTGSQYSVMNWEAARLIPDLDSFWRKQRREWEYRGAVGSFGVSGLVEIERLKIDKARWEKVEVIVTDLDSLSVIGSEGQPLFIAGANLFAGRDFVFDPAAGQMRVAPRRT